MLNRHTYVITLVFFLFSNTVYSQLKKGDEYYNRAEYIKAIVYYKKEANKKKGSENKKEALVKLGNSYRFINNYADAEDAYRRAIEEGGDINPQVFYDYAQVLKTNSKYEEAAEQFANYIKLAPNDENAKKAQKFCKEIKYYLTLPAEYTVKNIGDINTEKAEFSPFVMNKKLMFVAERESFDFVNYEVNDYNGQPFLNMYVSNLEGFQVKKSKTLSTKINSEFHDGPACMSADGKTLYFTRVGSSAKKGVINHSKIFSATGSDRKWKEVKPISINNDGYSIAHPCLSVNDSVLYFTSNMPGGYGGKDLYMSVKNADGWSEPLNLGPDINTSGDEMFPSIRKDGILFYSSNGLPGFGGLDIYSAKKIDSKWILQRNEGTELNSNNDDFGITFLNDSTGYFSSNRGGGKGSDDIYIYHYTNRSQVVDGTILLTENKKDYAKKKKVILIDEKGNPVDSMYTDEKGFFAFKHLSAGKKYMAAVSEDDPEFAGKARYYLADKDSVIQRVSHKLPNGKYAFKNMPIEPNSLPDLYTDDNLVFAGTLTSGDKNLSNVKMKIVNEKGQVLEEVTTDEKGNFVFRNIPVDQNYIVSVEETDIKLDEGSKITLTNKSGKEIKSFYKSKEPFNFKILSSDKSMLTEMKEEEIIPVLAGTLKSGDKILKNVKMKIVDEKGKVLEEVTTDANGNFVFKKIPPNSNYIVALDENDVKLEEGEKVSMVNKSGKELKSFYKTKDEFAFKMLATDKSVLTTMAVEEVEPPVFAGSLKSGNKALGNVRVKMVNELGEVIEEATTDEKGNFVFRNIPADKNYVLAIEEGDVQLTEGSKITLASQTGKEIKTFEKNKEEFTFKVLSTDKKVIDEMFVEDVDLVMEIFGYIYNQDKKPVPNAKITVKDEDGTNERHLVTNEAGKFRFKNLKEEKNYIFEADASDPGFAGVSRIYIADNKGRIYKVVELESGKFAFKILEMDKNALGEFVLDEPSMKLAEIKKAEKKNDLLAQANKKETGETTKKEATGKDVAKKDEVAKKEEVIKKEVPKAEEEEIDMTITIIENIYYAYGDYKLGPDGERILNKAVDILTENPRLIMEISSHTDSQSSAGFNLGLSNRRAQTAVDFLVAKGVPRARLKAIGYGETRLLNHCADNVPCGDEEHRLNRRTEFKISRKPAKK